MRDADECPTGAARRCAALAAWVAVCTIGLLALVGASPAHADMPRVAWVLVGNEANSAAWVAAFKAGLAEQGFEDGRNVRLDLRYADGKLDRYPALFAELTHTPAQVLAAAGEQGISAAQAAAKGRPVLAFFCGNIVEDMVQSFAKPGANTTGVACFSDELTLKRVELLGDAIPGLARIGYLYNPEVTGKERERRAVEAAAARLGLQLVPAQVNRAERIGAVVSDLAGAGAQAMVVAEDLFTLGNRAEIVAASLERRVPGAFALREFTLAGGLLSYGPMLDERFRQWGRYCGRILAGTPPEALPIDQPTHFELIVNRHTAKRLGLTLSPQILQIADEVID